MPRILIVAGFFLLSFSSFAQISTPEKHKFNIGVYGGLSIWKYRPMLAIDLSYKGTTLRLMPNYNYYSVGITQEILQISPVFYNLYWTGSVYGGYGYEYDNYPKISAENFKKVTYTGVVATGLKTYFSKRMYTHIMGGVMYNKTQVNGLPEEDKSQLLPYFEFGLGFQFFKTFPILKSEEME